MVSRPPTASCVSAAARSQSRASPERARCFASICRGSKTSCWKLAKSPSDPQAGVGSEIVLVVEDDPSVAHIVQSTLRTHGYEVLYAANGRQALEVADRDGRPVDLLFTDVVMPEMGGVQLAAEMTAKQPGLKVLFSSGYNDSALTQRGALVAGVDLLQKPYSPAVLVQRIRAKLDGPTSA